MYKEFKNDLSDIELKERIKRIVLGEYKLLKEFTPSISSLFLSKSISILSQPEKYSSKVYERCSRLKNYLSPEYAYYTLVMKGDNYIPGALVLGKSLREVKTKHKLICMVTEDVSINGKEILKLVYDQIVLVPYITGNCIPMPSQKQRDMYDNWINDSFTKWNILKIGEEYKKVLFVDADMIFLENCDHLFDLETPAAIFSLPWAKPY